jgi:hypothetical protein
MAEFIPHDGGALLVRVCGGDTAVAGVEPDIEQGESELSAAEKKSFAGAIPNCGAGFMQIASKYHKVINKNLYNGQINMTSSLIGAIWDGGHQRHPA